MPDPQDYDFRAVTKKDAALLKRWISSPHWKQWWGDPETELAEILDNLDSEAVEPMIAVVSPGFAVNEISSRASSSALR